MGSNAQDAIVQPRAVPIGAADPAENTAWHVRMLFRSKDRTAAIQQLDA